MYQWVYYDYYSCVGRYELEVVFEKLQPDLSVSSLSVSESGIVMDDADVTAYFTVANALLKSCGAFGVDLLVDGTKQSSFTVDGLSAGSSVRKSVPLGRLAAGRHTIVVKADVGNAVVESSESNNERSLTFKVYGRTPYRVVFDRNGGKGEMSDQSFIFGTEQALSRNVFSGQVGYVFKGWATSPNGGIAYLDGQVVNNLDLDSDGIETLYAVWELDYETVDGLKFRIFEGAATLVSADGATGDVVIPSTVRGFSVTRIGVGAFKGLSRVTSIVVPDSVTDIGAYAFSGCPNLTSVKLPSGLKQLNRYLFDECTSLVSITIPEGVEVVCSCAFEECRKLKGIDLPASVTNIGYAAFRECSVLEYANIPEAVKSLDGEAFNHCSSLKSIVMPDGFTDIGYMSFGSCTSLTSVELPSGMVAIAQSAFGFCSKLTSVKIPITVSSIGAGAFSECRSLKSIDLPVGVTNIGSSAFSYCTSLASITIPKGVSRIADYAYRGCKSLKSVSIPESVNGIGQGAFDECDGLGGGLVIIDGCVLGVLTVGGRCSGEVVLPEGTRLIADRAFYWNTDLRSITIPDSVTYIGSEAFKGCSGLSANGCVVVRGVLYDYCDRSRTVSIPEGVTDIGDWAFYGRDVGSVTIPSSVTNIGRSAFSGCMYLSTEIPQGVKSIGELAFGSCRYMEQISVPSSVVSIGRSAFSSCYSLATVSLSEGLQSIGSSAFSSCHSLASISLPEGLQSIGDYTFDDCSAIEEISIPSSVTEIGGNSVFRGCSNLKVIRVDERNQVYCSADGMLIEIAERKLILAPRGLRDVIIPEGIRSIGGDAFSGDKSLVFVSIPESVVDIAGFSGCSALKEISIPRGVKHVTGFANCTSLSTLTLHSSVESIESGAFYGCNAIKKVYVDHGDGVRIMSMLEESGLACGDIGFVELPPEEYAVSYVAGRYGKGTELADVKVQGSSLKLKGAIFTRTGYVQTGWSTTDGGGKNYDLGASYTADAGGVLYPYWTANTYVVTYVLNGGERASILPENEAFDMAFCVSAPVRTGYTFEGWNVTSGLDASTALWGTHSDPSARIGGSAAICVNGTRDVYFKNLTPTANGTVTLTANWRANTYKIRFAPNGGVGTMADQAATCDADLSLAANAFKREGMRFAGWATSAQGVVVYRNRASVRNLAFAQNAVVTLYAVWEEGEDVSVLYSGDAPVDCSVANVYDGILWDGENLVGLVQVKTAKQSIKTTTDKVTKEKTVTTNITATATVTDANGKKWSYSKGVVTVDGAVTGLKCTTKGCPVQEFGVNVGANGMDGVWGEYAIFGARNGMGTKGDAMMASLEAYKGKWSMTMSSAGETPPPQIVRLQLDVQAKGVVKIAGNWENGAKVNASAQKIMGDGFVYVPVMVKQTKTSPALNALLRIDANGEVALLSEGELVAGGRTVEALGEPVYLPSEVSVGGKAFGACVAVNELAYPVKFAAKKLPAGLKIDAAIGVISGTPTKPGRYIVEVTVASGLNSKAKKTLTVEFDIANYTDNLIPIKDSYGPYYVGVSTDERIAAATGCSVSGLPSGLKWTAKDIVDTKTKAVKTAANTVYGVPTKACTNTVYFKKTVKETVDGKTKSVTHQASATFRVEGMKPWAVGTFNGGGTNGIVTLTVAKTGKISGKWMSEGTNWTLSAASFDAYISSEQMYVATVIGKSGKLVMTNEIEVTENGVSSPLFEAWRNGWKEEPLKTVAKSLKGKKVSLSTPVAEDRGGMVELTVGASGAVTAKGRFVMGFDPNKWKNIIYSASCSTVLIPTAEAGLYRVYLYFPPKSGKFDGFSACESVMFAP